MSPLWILSITILIGICLSSSIEKYHLLCSTVSSEPNQDYYYQDPDVAEINVGHVHFGVRHNNLSLLGCGFTKLTRIVNGQEVEEYSYPFAALLFRDGHPFGGAVIINENWLLTVAHNFHRFAHSTIDSLDNQRLCFLLGGVGINRTTNPNDFGIGVGSVKIKNLEHYDVAKIFIHPKYERKQKYDIALIKLSRDLKFGRSIRPICFPDFSFQPLETDTVRTVGWGYKDYNEKKVSQTLQEIDLKVITLEECNEMYTPINETIVRSQICTWEHDKDTCIVSDPF